VSGETFKEGEDVQYSLQASVPTKGPLIEAGRAATQSGDHIRRRPRLELLKKRPCRGWGTGGGREDLNQLVPNCGKLIRISLRFTTEEGAQWEIEGAS